MTLTEELEKYSQEVIDSKYTCKKHKWACERFLRDLNASRTDPEYPYYFDEQKAEKFFAWCRLFKHRKGVLRGEHIELAPIQRFITGNIFGWIDKKTGYRRFNKMYWQVARKNAKSQTLALILLFLLFADGESSAECYCSATKQDQARIVYDEAEAMVRQCLPKKAWKIAYHRINHLKSGSMMRAMSKEDKKLGDGYNPHGASIDEYHAHETTEIYDVLDSGMGARTQPLLCIITTAGFELNNPCYTIEYNLVYRILNPNIDFDLDNYFAMVNELDKDQDGELLDSIHDEEVWKKCNPIICSYPEGIKYIRDKYKESIGVPEKMRNFLTKHMNTWVNMRECGYMDMEKWKACTIEQFPDLKGEPVYVGFDLSAKIDLTSVSFIFPFRSEEEIIYYVYSHSFIPEETLYAKMKTDKVPYDFWVKDGLLTVTPGAVTDYRAVRDYAINEIEKNGWRLQEFCMDSWGAIQLANDLVEKFGKNKVVEIIQGIKTLSEPTKDFRDMVYAKKVFHTGNPLLSWAMSNAIVDTPDRQENLILNKKKSIQRIDPVASIINAYVRAMDAPPIQATVAFI